MDSLPTELLELIVGFCDHTSQKALRSVNHTFHDLASRSVFACVHIAPCTSRTARLHLDSIRDSPRDLQRHIIHVSFVAELIPYWPHFEEFKAKASKHASDDRALESAFEAYRVCMNEQNTWLRSNEDFLRRFKAAVSSLPNLVAASTRKPLPFRGSTARLPIWKRLKESTLVSPDDWMYERRDYRWKLSTQVAALNLLEALGFRASFAGVKPITKLHWHMLNHLPVKACLEELWFERAASPTYSLDTQSRFQSLLATFAHLTSLDIGVALSSDDFHPSGVRPDVRQATQVLAGAQVSTMISSAPQLKTLQLSYELDTDVWEPSEASQHPLAPLFAPSTGKTPWASLERLDLSVNLPHTLLLSFLALLRPSLRHLSLRDMCVYDAQALLTELPRATTLERVYLECLWTRVPGPDGDQGTASTVCVLCEGSDANAAYEQALKAYLLGQMSQCPSIPELRPSDDRPGP